MKKINSQLNTLIKTCLKAGFFFVKTAIETLHEKEKELLKQLELFPEVIQNAAQNHSPALIANYTYDLVRKYNSFY